jgi:hypothetical protein
LFGKEDVKGKSHKERLFLTKDPERNIMSKRNNFGKKQSHPDASKSNDKNHVDRVGCTHNFFSSEVQKSHFISYHTRPFMGAKDASRVSSSNKSALLHTGTFIFRTSKKEGQNSSTNHELSLSLKQEYLATDCLRTNCVSLDDSFI